MLKNVDYVKKKAQIFVATRMRYYTNILLGKNPLPKEERRVLRDVYDIVLNEIYQKSHLNSRHENMKCIPPPLPPKDTSTLQ
jgi:hypothetical protein